MCAISINSYDWDSSESEGKRPKPTLLPHMRLQFQHATMFSISKSLNFFVSAKFLHFIIFLHFYSGIEPIVLNTQYRCHPQISRLCNNLFYDATLEDAVEERERESLLKVVDPKGSSLSNAVLVNISNGVEQLNSSGYGCAIMD